MINNLVRNKVIETNLVVLNNQYNMMTMNITVLLLLVITYYQGLTLILY